MGKTTLLETLLPLWSAKGLKVSVIKHAHHGFDIDKPGKDSYRHRTAGAHEVFLSGGERWVLMHELRGDIEPTLEEQVAKMDACDLIVVEGFKNAMIPKIEVWRAETGKPLLYPEDSKIIAVATDASLDDLPLPRLDLNNPQMVADFVLAYFFDD